MATSNLRIRRDLCVVQAKNSIAHKATTTCLFAQMCKPCRINEPYANMSADYYRANKLKLSEN